MIKHILQAHVGFILVFWYIYDLFARVDRNNSPSYILYLILMYKFKYLNLLIFFFFIHSEFTPVFWINCADLPSLVEIHTEVKAFVKKCNSHVWTIQRKFIRLGFSRDGYHMHIAIFFFIYASILWNFMRSFRQKRNRRKVNKII